MAPAGIDVPLIHKKRHPWQILAISLVILLIALVLWSVVTNKNFAWGTAISYLFIPKVMKGVLLSIEITFICMGIGIALGTLIAVMRISSNWFLSSVSWVYIWIFRSIPQLVQLVLWYNLGALYSTIKFGVPYGAPFFEVSTNDVITPFSAALLGLGLSQAGYTAEVVRAGILAVGKGQIDAAKSIGMRPSQVFFRIVSPQALRVIIPPVGNEFISMLKNSSLLSVIALPELFYTVQLIYSRTYETIPLLMTACIWYLFLVSLMTVGQYYLERRFSHGYK